MFATTKYYGSYNACSFWHTDEMFSWSSRAPQFSRKCRLDYGLSYAINQFVGGIQLEVSMGNMHSETVALQLRCLFLDFHLLDLVIFFYKFQE